MSSLIVSEPLRVVLKPSRLALYYLLFAHSVVLWALLQAGVYVVITGLVGCLFYYLCLWRRHDGVRLLQVQGENCVFECAQGTVQQGSLGARHFVSDFLLIVQVQQPLRHRYLILFRDALDEEAFRRLRVLLLFPEKGVSSNSLVSK